MVRKLHLVPITHEFGEIPGYRNVISDPGIKEYMDRISSDLVTYLDSFFYSIKDEPCDVIFHEGFLKTKNVYEITRAKTPATQKIVEFAKSKKCSRFEKTEEKKDIKFHAYLTGFHRVFPTPKIRDFVGKITDKLEDAVMRKRDYNMAKNVSRGLKENETGILFYGANHHPEGYINRISPDIKLVFHEQTVSEY